MRAQALSQRAGLPGRRPAGREPEGRDPVLWSNGPPLLGIQTASLAGGYAGAAKGVRGCR
jgi:hypothetical protein